MIKVKDIIDLFDVVVDLYYKGQYVMNSMELEEINKEHWIMEEKVTNICVGDCEVSLETR